MNIFKWLTSKKYRIFYKKIGQVQISIWEYEFKINKSRKLREEIRQDRDRAVESANALSARVAKDDKEKEEIEAMVKYETDRAQRFERQMKLIDDQITGIPADGESPGLDGLIDTIKTHVELKKMYSDYVKTL